MRKRIFKIIIVILTMLLFFSAAALGVTAEATGGFTVSPNLPDNQKPESTGFFDLYVDAGQVQQITMVLSNYNDFEASFAIRRFTIGTNRDGILEYMAPVMPDETLQHDFADIATLAIDERVVVSANSSVIIPVNISVPEQGFDGIILGAVQILRDTAEQDAEPTLDGFAHLTLVRLEQRGTPAVPAYFILGNVGSQTVNNTVAIVAEIRNPMPRLAMGAMLDAQVYLQGRNVPIFNMTNIAVDFAPNTIFPLTMIDDAGLVINQGDYFARFQLHFEGQTWEFEREFSVTPQAAGVTDGTLNPAYSLITVSSTLLIGIGIGIVLIVVVLAVIREVKSYKRDLIRLEKVMRDNMMVMESQGIISNG